MAHYDIFISYNSLDHDAVESVAEFLRDSGVTTFLDRWYLPAGQPWQSILEKTLAECGSVAIFLGPNEMGSWQQREKDLALDRQAHNRDFPVIPVLLPGAEPPLGFLSQSTWIDLREDIADQNALKLLANAALRKSFGDGDSTATGAIAATMCPYRGLSYFREEDAPFFFGREAVTDRLVGAVRNSNLTALVGPSGSGKSSVVRAGLLPNLRLGSGETTYEIITLVPGSRPLRALASALLPALEPDKWLAIDIDELALLKRRKELADLLADDTEGLRNTVERIIEKQTGTDRLLLFVDQWEELYTMDHNAGEAEKFVDAILDATLNAPLSAVLTLRGDFYGHALEYGRLSDRLQDNILNLRPMNTAELQRAIVEPASAVGLQFEAGLVERILDDIGQEPGNLPLLEFVLRELWLARKGQTVHHAPYLAMGGVKGAIGGRAEAVYQKLKSENGVDDALLEGLFLKLVRTGEALGTRQRVVLVDLDQRERLVAEALTKERLLVAGRDPATEKETVEVAHEALIERWNTLRGWLDQNRDFLAWRTRLYAVSEAWEESHDSAWILRGHALSEARRWLKIKAAALNKGTVNYIAASIRAHRKRLWVMAGTVTAVLLLIVLIVVGILSTTTVNVYFPADHVPQPPRR